jgi:ADP-ribosylglycohydrolase
VTDRGSQTARVVAALKGVAAGDAIGKQTETLSRAGVIGWYPQGVSGFEGEPGTVIPRYAGNAKREWRIGETTDDTESTIAVARAVLRDGGVSHESVGRELLTCRKSVHPGVKSLWEFHQAGDPARVDTTHDGCGAAIRMLPVGVLYQSSRLDDIVAAAREASIPTHGGALALAAAAATAAAVSAAIDGRSPGEIFGLAERAATAAETARSQTNESAFAAALRKIRRELSEWGAFQPDYLVQICHPVTPLTIVPLAINLATMRDSAEEAILLAANVGGDADSVASIAGAILGARHPETVNEDWVAVVEQVNGHDLVSIAARLARLRQ